MEKRTSKEVLFVYDNAEKAFKKEFELVEAAKQDKLCYNLRQGGSGGFGSLVERTIYSYLA